MTAACLIPVAEYLQTSYQPDREYIDGEVLERNVGKWSHARVQWLLALWFGRHEPEWNVIGSIEQRVQVSPTRIRVPDLVILRPGPQPDVLTMPPLLIIEILSPNDSYSSLQVRCQDYLSMGAKNVWIIDPNTCSGRMCDGDNWILAERLTVADTAIFVELGLLFSQLHTPSQA